MQFIYIWRTIRFWALMWRGEKKVHVYRNQMQHFHIGMLPLAAPCVFIWSEAPFRRLLLSEGHCGAVKCFVKCCANTHSVWERGGRTFKCMQGLISYHRLWFPWHMMTTSKWRLASVVETSVSHEVTAARIWHGEARQKKYNEPNE